MRATMATKAKKHTVDLTTGIGTLSFPKIFPDTKGTKDDGTADYNVQIIISKSQKADIKAMLLAIQEVGKAQYGDNWRKVRNPLRDGDKEKDTVAEDGQTYEDKYPERLGCFFINARSQRPPAVVARDRSAITDSSDVYGGCKGKISVTFYPYAQSGNVGIGCSLNGVQKISDGEPFGGGAPPVESMFDLIEGEDDEDTGLDDVDLDDEPEEKPAKKSKKGKAKKSEADEDDDLYAGLDDSND